MLKWLAPVLFAVAAQAAVINFDDLVLPDYGDVPSGYGSTASIGVSYRTLSADAQTVSTNNLELWNSGYGNLSKVAFATSDGLVAEITFTALIGGEQVTLNSFDMAGYFTVNRTNDFFRILNGSGTVLLDYVANNGGNPVTILGAGPSHSTFSPAISASVLRLQWGHDWNIGIDNINVTSAAIPTNGAVPEPGTFALVGVAVAGLALLRRRS